MAAVCVGFRVPARCCGVAPTTPPMMHRRLAAPCLPRQANQRSACTLVPPLRTAGGSLKHQHWILPAAQRLLISPTLSRTPFSVPGHSCCTVVASIFFATAILLLIPSAEQVGINQRPFLRLPSQTSLRTLCAITIAIDSNLCDYASNHRPGIISFFSRPRRLDVLLAADTQKVCACNRRQQQSGERKKQQTNTPPPPAG